MQGGALPAGADKVSRMLGKSEGHLKSVASFVLVKDALPEPKKLTARTPMHTLS
jgi:hypothetical protein